MTTQRLTADGTRLITRGWGPSGMPRSVIVLVHGLGEHGGRYEHVAALLVARGHAVRATDLRGFGASGGRRAFVRSWDDYLDDLVTDVAAARAVGSPVVLLGHSMGGLVALAYALSKRPAPDLLVLSAPGLDADIPVVKRLAARVLGVVMPRLSVANGLRGDQLSQDPSVGERYFADPLVFTRTTLALARRALLAGARCRANLSSLTLPTLVAHGGADTIVPPGVSAPLAAVPGVDRIVFPDFRHEIFNEEGGVPATTRVADWIEARR